VRASSSPVSVSHGNPRESKIKNRIRNYLHVLIHAISCCR
jgi:hypothetical protein